jgi:apolipoprotein N-acyltransferase
VTVALAAAHAALFVAGFPGIGWWPLAFVSPVPLAWLAINARSGRRAVLAVLAVQFLMWLWIDRWIIAVTAWGYPFLAGYLSLYAALFVWIVRAMSRHRVLARWPLTLLLPVAWVGLECLRGELLFDGYPWFLIAHPVIEWPQLAQSADLLGVYFVSFLVAMVAGLLVDGLRARRDKATPRAFVVAAVVVGAAHLTNLVYGGWRLSQAATLSAGPVVLAIQTNLPQDNKVAWLPRQQVEDLARFIDQTERAFAAAVEEGARPDVVIWPETMLPGYGLEPGTIETLVEGGYFPGDAFSRAVEGLAERLGTPLLVGSPTYLGLRPADGRWQWDAHYNSAYLIDGRPPYQRYDKFFLTPFGETMPYISKWPWLEGKMLAVGAEGMRFDLDSNPSLKRLGLRWARPAEAPPGDSDLGGRASLTVATPICFEDTVAGVCRRMVYPGPGKTADLFVNLSNDGWFGPHDAGRRQHAQAARFRCVENRVPMIRAVNTGLSSAIDSCGRLRAAVGPGRYGTARRSGWLLAELPLDARRTLYGRVGDAWAWACLAGVVALGAWTVISNGRETGT